MNKSFSELMIEKFPDLFPKDADGNPTQPSCGFYCPPGWEHVVESALFYINSTVKNPSTKQTWVWWHTIATKLHGWTIRPIYNKLHRMTSPTEKFHWRDGKRLKYGTALTQKQIKTAEEAAPMKTFLNNKLRAVYQWTTPKWRFKHETCRPVQIDQVKEKFGGLRLYISGGNAKTRAIASFAEVLSERICEETGAPGNSVSRGGWCKTLSPEFAKKMGYK